MEILEQIKIFANKYKSQIAILSVIVVIAVFVIHQNSDFQGSVAIEQQQIAEEAVSDNAINSSYFVEITGYVNNPGVYELSKDLLVIELIQLAGGLHPNADMKFIHKDVRLSAISEPGYKLFVPAKTQTSSTNSVTSATAVSINTASMQELQTLSGVGPSTAQKIIDSRPYKTLEDLLNVLGIGNATFEKLKSQISL